MTLQVTFPLSSSFLMHFAGVECSVTETCISNKTTVKTKGLCPQGDQHLTVKHWTFCFPEPFPHFCTKGKNSHRWFLGFCVGFPVQTPNKNRTPCLSNGNEQHETHMNWSDVECLALLSQHVRSPKFQSPFWELCSIQQVKKTRCGHKPELGLQISHSAYKTTSPDSRQSQWSLEKKRWNSVKVFFTFCYFQYKDCCV